MEYSKIKVGKCNYHIVRYGFISEIMQNFKSIFRIELEAFLINFEVIIRLKLVY